MIRSFGAAKRAAKAKIRSREQSAIGRRDDGVPTDWRKRGENFPIPQCGFCEWENFCHTESQCFKVRSMITTQNSRFPVIFLAHPMLQKSSLRISSKDARRSALLPPLLWSLGRVSLVSLPPICRPKWAKKKCRTKRHRLSFMFLSSAIAGVIKNQIIDFSCCFLSCQFACRNIPKTTPPPLEFPTNFWEFEANAVAAKPLFCRPQSSPSVSGRMTTQWRHDG